MKKTMAFLVIGFSLASFSAIAQIGSGYNSSYSNGANAFGTPKPSPWAAQKTKELEPKEEIIDRIRFDASNVIFKADNVKCFGVKRKSLTFEGETLSGYAVSGTCGELSKDGIEEVKKEIFAQNSESDFNIGKCSVNPSILLRFTKGHDTLDVALSPSPCPVAKVMYAGRSTSIGLSPLAKWLGTFVSGMTANMKEIDNQKDAGAVEADEVQDTPNVKAWIKQAPAETSPETPKAVESNNANKNSSSQQIKRSWATDETPASANTSGSGKPKIKKAWDIQN